MKKGLELFKKKDNSIFNFEIYENKLGFNMPIKFKEFYSQYKLGLDQLDLETYFNSDLDDNEIIGPATHLNNNKRPIIIEDFYDLDSILEEWTDMDQYEETGKNMLLPIAALGSDPNGGLYLGFGETNYDEIWRVNWDLGDESFEKISDNIYDFITDLFQDRNDL